MKRYSMLMNGKINIRKMPTLPMQSINLKISLSKFQWCSSKELGRNKHKFDIESHDSKVWKNFKKEQTWDLTLSYFYVRLHIESNQNCVVPDF